jgi:hypothetical protein
MDFHHRAVAAPHSDDPLREGQGSLGPLGEMNSLTISDKIMAIEAVGKI